MRYFLWHLRGGIAGFSPDFTWIHKGKTAKLLKPNHRLCSFAYIFEMMTYTIQNWINEKWKDDKYTNSIFEMTYLLWDDHTVSAVCCGNHGPPFHLAALPESAGGIGQVIAIIARGACVLSKSLMWGARWKGAENSMGRQDIMLLKSDG